MFKYRLKRPVSVLVERSDRFLLIELPTDSEFVARSCVPDASGMIAGTCEEKIVLVFSRDLEDRAERIFEETSPDVEKAPSLNERPAHARSSAHKASAK